MTIPICKGIWQSTRMVPRELASLDSRISFASRLLFFLLHSLQASSEAGLNRFTALLQAPIRCAAIINAPSKQMNVGKYIISQTPYRTHHLGNLSSSIWEASQIRSSHLSRLYYKQCINFPILARTTTQLSKAPPLSSVSPPDWLLPGSGGHMLDIMIASAFACVSNTHHQRTIG